MTVLIKVGIFFLNCIYRLFWLFPRRLKVVFISREADTPSVDIRLLMERIEEQDLGVEVRALCKTIGPGLKSKISYAFHMLSQMYHMATARVVVLDTYCIAASVLRHRKGLTIIQMWHAVGCLKKFSYSILDKEEGRSGKLARAMKMHHNYDQVLVSGEICKDYLAEAYNCSKDIMRVIPLPRIDIVKKEEEREKSKARIQEKYPQIGKKKTILYVPTFRKHGDQTEAICRLIEAVDLQKYDFVLKYHPIVQSERPISGIIVDQDFSSLDWMNVSDYVITDYSAACFEAAAAGKPLFFYTYDWEYYKDERNFYIDYEAEMPGVISGDPKEIVQAIETDNYDLERVERFAKIYVSASSDCTGRAAQYILAFV